MRNDKGTEIRTRRKQSISSLARLGVITTSINYSQYCCQLFPHSKDPEIQVLKTVNISFPYHKRLQLSLHCDQVRPVKQF